MRLFFFAPLLLVAACQAPKAIRTAHATEAIALSNYDYNADVLVRGLIDLKARKDRETIALLFRLDIKKNTDDAGNIPAAKVQELIAKRDAVLEKSRQAAANARDKWEEIRGDFHDALELHAAIREFHETGISDAVASTAKEILSGLTGE